MKKNIILKGIAVAVATMSLVSCADFLDRPSVDNYNVSNFYQTDEQCEQGVNYLYNSPWYDFIRAFIKVGEVMSGNYYWGSSPYLEFSTNGTDEDLVNMSYSLWAVNGHANTVIDNIVGAQGPSQAAKDKYIGEALVWKAFAYFYMVRTFGEVPIVHNNTELIGSGAYNEVKKVARENVYEYIIMTLEEALKLLPKQTGNFNDKIRIDYYGAEALLAKVYLTKAGLGGSITSAEAKADLEKARDLAKDVIDNSGRSLDPNYEQIFRMSDYNTTGECLISWMWAAGRDPWTQQNSLQCDLAMGGFSDQGDTWGGWQGPSVDLQEAFGVHPYDDPAVRLGEKDKRRKCTMMMAGDTYSYFWQDKGGFDFLKFVYDTDYGKGGPGGQLQCPTGSNNVKHLYGNDYDHTLATGLSPANMAYQLPTHLLRLSDLYLVYAEADLLTGGTDAKEYVNKVRERAGVDALASVTWEDIWKERRLELAIEGDRWYDFVRRSYYDAAGAIAEIKAQKRSAYESLDGAYKKYVYDDSGKYVGTGTWVAHLVDTYQTEDSGEVIYKPEKDNPNVTVASFKLPFPTADVTFNGNMASDAQVDTIDVRATYKYNF